MKKVILIVFLILVGFSINTNYVLADTKSGYNGMPSDVENKISNNSTGETCGLFGDPSDPNAFAYYLQKSFDIIRFAGPILVILMTIFDLVKVTAEQKQDGELKKIGIKTLKRVIYAVILFALPTLINVVFDLIGLYGTCGIS